MTMAIVRTNPERRFMATNKTTMSKTHLLQLAESYQQLGHFAHSRAKCKCEVKRKLGVKQLGCETAVKFEHTIKHGVFHSTDFDQYRALGTWRTRL